MPEFYMRFARKINKIPEFYMIYARKKLKNSLILHDFCPKNSFCRIGGSCPPCPLSPTPMLKDNILQLYFPLQKCYVGQLGWDDVVDYARPMVRSSRCRKERPPVSNLWTCPVCSLFRFVQLSLRFLGNNTSLLLIHSIIELGYGIV